MALFGQVALNLLCSQGWVKLLFETGYPYVASADLKLIELCLCLLSGGIKGACCHTQLNFYFSEKDLLVYVPHACLVPMEVGSPRTGVNMIWSHHGRQTQAMPKSTHCSSTLNHLSSPQTLNIKLNN